MLAIRALKTSPHIYDQRRFINDLYVGYSTSINVKSNEINILYGTIEYFSNGLSGN